MVEGAGLDAIGDWRDAVKEVTYALAEVEKLKKETGEKENGDDDRDEDDEGSEAVVSVAAAGRKRKQACVFIPFPFFLLSN